jgi:hypothetical protein
MLKLETGERGHPANSWGRLANTVAVVQLFSQHESLHENRVLLIEVLEDHKSLEVGIETLDRLEKIFKSWIMMRVISNEVLVYTTKQAAAREGMPQYLP